jgi:Domain of unknown function (DUF5666)
MAGTVTAVSGSTITITDWDGFTREIHVSGSTTYTDGLTAIPKVGDKIHAEGTVDADKTSLDATTIGLMTDTHRPAPADMADVAPAARRPTPDPEWPAPSRPGRPLAATPGGPRHPHPRAAGLRRHGLKLAIR